MRNRYLAMTGLLAAPLLLLAGCGSGGPASSPTPPAATVYTLTINSTNPASGVAITASPTDNNHLPTGETSFTLSYAAGTIVTLTAPTTVGANPFGAWTGCGSVAANVCTVTVNANTTVSVAYVTPAPTIYALTVNSMNPSNGVAIAATPADNGSLTGGNTTFTLNYAAGTTVKLTAPASAGSNNFSAWTGCTSAAANVCTVVMNAAATVSASYAAPVNAVTGVTVTPATQSVVIGSGQQFAATVAGTGTFDPTVTWSASAGNGSLDPGTITANGLYQSPYPAPASVTVTATSKADPTKFGSAIVTLVAPARTAGPSLKVDAGAQTHAISPLIYGMNQYTLDPSIAARINLPIDRWGGDATTRYNYQLDIANSANDYYFEQNPNSNTAYPDVSQFNTQAAADEASDTKTIATVPLIGYTTKRQKACSYSIAKYGAQTAFDPYWTDCGNGVKPDGSRVVNDPADTSVPIDESFVSGWVQYLVKRYGTAASGGVYEYQLDNEPEYWSGVHPDVHPAPSTYDEITNKGLTYAAVVKAADPTAAVGGPAISGWTNYFYSWKDLVSGWSTGPCYCFNGNPIDRQAHGNIPLLQYYLQQFKAYDDAHGVRLLDYLDLHGYYAGTNTAFAVAGDTATQALRLASTRNMWDPNYLNGYPNPDSVSQNPAQEAVQLVPRMKQLVASYYPGTRTAVMEYNWGGQEHINGALAQVDLLGIFGREGLDMAALWGPPDPVKQFPGLAAFLLYRNYDGAGSAFGDISLTSTSGDQTKLAVYGGLRSSDGSVTIMVVNKTFGDLTSQLSIANGPATSVSVKLFQYSNAQIGSIAAMPAVTLPAPATTGGSSALSLTFPASSVTLLVVPKS